MYKDYYAQPNIEELSVERAPVEGRLFLPGRSQAHAELTSGDGTAAFMVRNENGWKIETVEDVSVQSVAQTLCSAEVSQNKGPDGSEGYDHDTYDAPSDVDFAPSPLLECTWNGEYRPANMRVTDHSISATGNNSDTHGIFKMVIVGIIILVVLFVMFRSKPTFQELKVDLMADEVHIDTLDQSILGFQGKLTLTNKRIVFRYVTWLFATTRMSHIPLSSVKLVNLHHGVLALLLLVSLFLIPIIAPLALLFTIYSLATNRAKLVFRLGLSFWSRRKAFSIYGSENALLDGTRFLRNTLRHAGETQGGAIGSSDIALPPLKAQRGLLDQSILPKLLMIMAVVAIERLFFGGVNFENWILLVPFMAIPILSGVAQGPANGGIIGLFSGLGLVSMLQPMPKTGTFSAGDGLDVVGILVVITVLGFSGVIAGWVNNMWERPANNQIRKAVFYCIGLTILWFTWYSIPGYLESPSAGTMTWVTSCSAALGVVLLWMGREGLPMPTALAGALSRPSSLSQESQPIFEETDDADTSN
jgi:hypothetical protein